MIQQSQESTVQEGIDQEGTAQEDKAKAGVPMAERVKDFVTDPGIGIAVGNAIFIPSPFTIAGAIALAGTNLVGNINPKLSLLKNPNFSLILAGVSLIPTALISFMNSPWTGGWSELVASNAFMGGVVFSIFTIFNITKALENMRLWVKFKNKGLGRVANAITKPELAASVGLGLVASMAGGIGLYVAPLIATAFAFSVYNSQKDVDSNVGSPKMMLAGVSFMSATLPLLMGSVNSLNAVLANFIYAAVYVRMEMLEKNSLLKKFSKKKKPQTEKVASPT